MRKQGCQPIQPRLEFGVEDMIHNDYMWIVRDFSMSLNTTYPLTQYLKPVNLPGKKRKHASKNVHS